MMPPQGSPAEQRLTGAFNAKTRVSDGSPAARRKLVAEGVWVVQGQPGRCNVYLIEDEGGVTVFDAGARTMTRARRPRRRASSAGSSGSCSATGTPTTAAPRPGWARPCSATPTEVQDAEGSGGLRYWPAGLAGLPFRWRQVQQACCTATPGTAAR